MKSDYAMPEVDGDDVAKTMKHMKPDVRIRMFSGVLGTIRKLLAIP